MTLIRQVAKLGLLMAVSCLCSSGQARQMDPADIQAMGINLYESGRCTVERYFVAGDEPKRRNFFHLSLSF